MVKAQNKDFNIAIMNMLKDFEENMNKSTNEIYEKTNGGIK